MEDLQTMNSPEVTVGQEATTASPQVTETPEQSGSQQQTVATTQVENGANTSSAEDQRRASDYETARQIKRLAKQMQSMQQAFERSSQQVQPNGQPQTQRQQVTQDELLKNPLDVINRLIEEKVNGVKSEIPKQFEQFNQQTSQQRAMQEGYKIAYTNEAVKRDPEGDERMRDIFLEEDEDGNTLDKYSLQNPRHAAKLALDIYKQRFTSGQRKASAPSKAQMTSTATSVNPGAGQGKSTNDEAAQWLKEFNNNPKLMDDPAFMKRLNDINNRAKQDVANG